MERPGLRECLPSAGETGRFLAALFAGTTVMYALWYMAEPPGGAAYNAYAILVGSCFGGTALAVLGALSRDRGVLFLAGLCWGGAGAVFIAMLWLVGA